MKFFLIFLFAFILNNNPVFCSPGDLEKILTEVNSLEEKKLPESARNLALTLEKKALAEKNKGMYIRALAKRILNECHIRGKMPKDKIKILKEEIAKVDSENRPLVKIILARWYWHYYQQNSYKFASRTQTSGLNNDDFTTWDLNKIFSEIRLIFDEVLKDANTLKKMKLDDYQSLINRGNLFIGKPLSVYEFAVKEEINFLVLGASSLPSPEDKFEIEANSDVFSHYKTFINYKAQTTDTESSLLRAIVLYQELLSHYEKEKSTEQFIDTDLNRLKLIYAQVKDADSKDIYLKKLVELEDEFIKFSTTTLVSYEIALLYKNDEDNNKAIEICEKTIARFPKSDGAHLCGNLLLEIKHPTITIQTESSINKSNSTAFIKYKNVKKLYFKIVEDNWNERFKATRGAHYNEYLERDVLEKLLRQKSVKEWVVDLEETKDFKEREMESSLPELSYGFYRVFASTRPDFNSEYVSHTSFWRTDTLFIVKGNRSGVNGFVLDARTGRPLENKKINVFQVSWKKLKQNYENELVKTLTTNKAGEFTYLGVEGQTYFGVESADTGNTFYTAGVYREYRAEKISRRESALIMTDRAIYRPDQRIHFKVICYYFDQKEERYEIYKCQNTTVKFVDTNNKEITRVTKSANEFGSFSGDFIAPKNLLTGLMSLRIDQPNAMASIRIEEYKRPKFEVVLNPPTKQYRLDETVSILGNAKSYAGAPLISAKVKYRVLRTVELPPWWFFGNPFLAEQEIAHGVSKTNDSGDFNIDFKALPNKKVSTKLKPIFHYKLSVDVIDSTGETRSANIVTNIGTVSLKAQMSVADWLPDNQDVKINITTLNLDNEIQEAKGEIEVFKLNGPKKVVRATSNESYFLYWFKRFYFSNEAKLEKKDLSKIENWEIGESVFKNPFSTVKGLSDNNFKLNEGAYVAVLKTKDQFQNLIEEKKYFTVFSLSKSHFKVGIPSFFKVNNASFIPGSELQAIIGSGHETGSAHIEFSQNGNTLKSYWSSNNTGKEVIHFPITENLKGGFSLQVFYVQENQLYHYTQFINVTRPEKDLKVLVEKMSSKLRPGQSDKWTLKVTDFKNKNFSAELAATMYDASLDTFVPYHLPHFYGEWSDYRTTDYFSTLKMKDFYPYHNWDFASHYVDRRYPEFNYDILNQFYYLWPIDYGGMMYDGAMPMATSMMKSSSARMEMSADKESLASAPAGAMMANEVASAPAIKQEEKKPEVKMRTNLNETAFFYPQLITDDKGNINFEFTMPEALTRWKFYALAHGKENQIGSVMKEVVTEQELMITPNAPRFLRQGDKIYFSVKIDNTSDLLQKGEVQLDLKNALNDKEVFKEFVNTQPKLNFEIPAKKSASFSWQLNVPEVNYPVIYQVKAIGEKFSDGEEGLLPVLSKKVYVQESMPLWISDIGEKKFNFLKLTSSESSKSLKNDKLILQMVSNPTWYAVQALPYISKSYPECTDYLFERFFANSLGENIVDKNPGIEKIFKAWEGTPALKSNLQKNADLKRLNLEETPWVMNAENEEKGKHDVAKFFQKNNLHQELSTAYHDLEARMLEGGGWPWFPGGPQDHYTTLYIVTGFGKLKSLGLNVQMDLALKSIPSLDHWIKEIYDLIKKDDLDKNHYSPLVAYYLYGRSFFLKEMPIANENNIAVSYFKDQAKKYWTSLNSRLSEANTGIALIRFNEKETSDLIIKSLKERALHNEELGMYWADEEFGYWWYRAPIEAQARIIELFSATGNLSKEIDQMNIWLIKQKQTQDWKTSKATSEVIYNLLYSGRDLLKSNKLVDVTLANKKITPQNIEAGTGFYEQRFSGKDVHATMGDIKLIKSDKGVAWGGLHWHYFEDIDKITPHKTPLTLKKTLWVKKDTKKGPTLFPIASEKLEVGDTLVARIELNSDRDMEYVHMKDMRGSGTEPVNVLSTWKYQDGLSYYESTRDQASHFFFSYLPKGTYVFEYELKIFHKGEYQSGMAEIQSMYAPEFSSHSESFKLEVK